MARTPEVRLGGRRLAEDVARQRIGRRDEIVRVFWYDVSGWRPHVITVPDGPHGEEAVDWPVEQRDGYAFERYWLPLGGSYWIFAPVTETRWPDGTFAASRGLTGFHPYTRVRAPHLFPVDAEPLVEPDQMRAYGMADYLALVELWSRLRARLRRRRSSPR